MVWDNRVKVKTKETITIERVQTLNKLDATQTLPTKRGSYPNTWYNGCPIMITDVPVSSAKLLAPSIIIGIKQHPGWLVVHVLASLAMYESYDSVQVRHLNGPEQLLVCKWDQTLCVAGIGVEAWGLQLASASARWWVWAGSAFEQACPPEPCVGETSPSGKSPQCYRCKGYGHFAK